MPGFKWKSEAKIEAMAKIIFNQSTRCQGTGTLCELEQRGHEQIVNKKVVSDHLQFMQETLTEFAHGPPCISSILASVRLHCKLAGDEGNDSWIGVETTKIKILWRFVWGCYKRSKNSQDYAMSRLKAIIEMKPHAAGDSLQIDESTRSFPRRTLATSTTR